MYVSVNVFYPAEIDLFHNGGQILYSFALMLISLTSLPTTSKFQKNICFKTRAVGLINIKTRKNVKVVAICESGLLDDYFEEAENAHQDYIIIFDHGNTCQLVHWEGIDGFEWSGISQENLENSSRKIRALIG